MQYRPHTRLFHSATICVASITTPVFAGTPAPAAELVVFGFATSVLGILALVLVLVIAGMAGLMVYRMVKRKDTPANAGFSGLNKVPPAPARMPAMQAQVPSAAFEPSPQVQAGPTLGSVPPDFDRTLFLSHAKSTFNRMQAAWDKHDLADLRSFTTPQVYAELKQQIGQGGASAAVTEVVALDAELLGIETIGDEYLATVRFNGQIKTASDAPAAPIAEVWNMCRARKGNTGWMLAGIQQLS